MLGLNLEKHLDELNAISAQASKEFALENALKKMKKDWEGMFFSFVPYKETGVSILSAFDDIQVRLNSCLFYHNIHLSSSRTCNIAFRVLMSASQFVLDVHQNAVTFSILHI